MNKYRKYIPIVALVLLGLGVNLEKFGIDLKALSGGASISQSSSSSQRNSAQSGSRLGQAPDYKQWSNTQPELNLWHIFEGEINRKRDPVGFHSRPGGQDPANARVVKIRDKPNKHGIYTATTEIFDGSQWKEKSFASFFPDDMSRDEVIAVILSAYKNSKNKNARPWQGPSGLGFNIQGYTTSRGGINTAFPVYTR